MYRLCVKEHFDAAHSLRGYPGDCAKLHGHTWDVEVQVEGERLNEIEIVYDFRRLKQDLREVLDRFDHKHLNEVAPFDRLSPTGENLARHIFEELERRIGEEVRVVRVNVWESPQACISYEGKR
ncbi:MAG: 6-carboxytetrahydropterin synthase QueD [Actinobacteria bacterium]|nr:MAG: 6-carboxytetrahydropterin synthase QueD [Actinomycetota bacterium]